MAARILSLARVHRRPSAPEPIALGVPVDVPARLHFWRGASGKRYVHCVYSLIECPPLPNATYALVSRTKDGRRQVLQIATAESDAPTLNLAHIRQRGAQLGANEVHVHFPADTRAQRRLATCDLRAGQFGELSSEPSVAAHH
jgi:hypothetical protein